MYTVKLKSHNTDQYNRVKEALEVFKIKESQETCPLQIIYTDPCVYVLVNSSRKILKGDLAHLFNKIVAVAAQYDVTVSSKYENGDRILEKFCVEYSISNDTDVFCKGDAKDRIYINQLLEE